MIPNHDHDEGTKYRSRSSKPYSSTTLHAVDLDDACIEADLPILTEHNRHTGGDHPGGVLPRRRHAHHSTAASTSNCPTAPPTR